MIGQQIETNLLMGACAVLLLTTLSFGGCAYVRGQKLETAKAVVAPLKQGIREAESGTQAVVAINAECVGEKNRVKVDADKAIDRSQHTETVALAKRRVFERKLANPEPDCEAFLHSQVCSALADY